MAVEMRVRIRWDVGWEGGECGCGRAEHWDGTLVNMGERMRYNWDQRQDDDM